MMARFQLIMQREIAADAGNHSAHPLASLFFGHRWCGFGAVADKLTANGFALIHRFAIGDVVYKLRRQSERKRYAPGVLQTVLEMRSGRIAAVATLADHVALLHFVARLDLDAALLQVQEQRVFLVSVV